MNDVALQKPYPQRDDLAERLIEEDRRGGVRLIQWREAYPQSQYAEVIELKNAPFIAKMLSDAYGDEAEYHVTVQFIAPLRAQVFAEWLATQTS